MFFCGQRRYIGLYFCRQDICCLLCLCVMSKLRLNVRLFLGFGGILLLMWLSFLFGTMSSSFVDTETNTKLSDAQSRKRQGVTEVPCVCSKEDPEGEDFEKDQEKDREKDSYSSEDFVIVHREPEQPSVHTLPPSTRSWSSSLTARNSVTISGSHQPYPLKWTTVDKTGTTIFSAYYDERSAMHGPSIVLPGYQSKKFRHQTLFCLFTRQDGSKWCSKHLTILKEMDACNEQKEFDKKNERQFLHVFHICTLHDFQDEIDDYSEIPSHVALSANPECDRPSKDIQVYNFKPEEKMEFGVCIQTPVFAKLSQDFVNFIELYKLLGAQFFTLYVLNIDHTTLAYLHKTYGGNDGILDIVQWTSHLHEKEPIHYYGEILAIHDCLYRNMHRFKYLAFVDLDEAIVPRRYPDWYAMMKELDQPYVDSFIFPNSIFMKTEDDNVNHQDVHEWSLRLCKNTNLPFYFTNFNRVKCVFNYFSRSKLIVKPELIIDTDIHGVCNRTGNTTHYLVPEDSAASQHYRTIPTIECRKDRKTRKWRSRHDSWMTKYASSLLPAIKDKLCV